MQEVGCRTCGTRVLVKKNSLPHTSIQWTTDATVTCEEISSRVAGGEYAAHVTHCDALRESIEQAVREGMLKVSSDD